MKLKKSYKRVTAAAKKIFAMIVVFAMVLEMIPTTTLTFAAENTTENTVSVYFNNTESQWSSVFGYVWGLSDSWPGTQLSELSGQPGYCKFTCDYTPESGNGLTFIFSNGNDAQTIDLSISHDTLTADGGPQVDGHQVTFTYESASADKVCLAGTMNEWSTTAAQMTEEDNVFTYTTELEPGIYEYKYVADSRWINDPENPVLVAYADNNMNNVVIVTGLLDSTARVVKGTETELPAQLGYVTSDGSVEQKEVTYTLKTEDAADSVILDGNKITVSTAYAGESLELTATAEDGSEAVLDVSLENVPLTECSIKLHFVNTVGWDNVYVHAWKDSGDEDESITTWPGNVVTKDEGSDTFYTVEFSYLVAVDKNFGFLFNNAEGSSTMDLSIDYDTMVMSDSVELWIAPGVLRDDGKYACTRSTVAPGPGDIVISPEVDGDQVTFRYRGSAAETVALAGTMNDWNAEAELMTKDENGIYTCTVTLEPGIYQYKYVVDGENWISDPLNSATVGTDGNSVVVVPDTAAEDENQVTVKLHYSRSDKTYTGWNAWMWLDGQDGAQYDFVEEDGDMVATITVNGRENSAVNFVIRKSVAGNDWSEKEGEEDCVINIGNVLSGTVHYYVTSGSTSGTKVLGPDAVTGNKILSAEYDYETSKVVAETAMPVSGDPADSFTKVYSADAEYAVSEIVSEGYTNTLTLDKEIALSELNDEYKITFEDYDYPVSTSGIYATDRFAEEYTYDGDDLGAVWSEDSTTFKVWAPTAEMVRLKLYNTGSDAEEDSRTLGTYDMRIGEKGVWSITLSGNLLNKYYTYYVTNNGETKEACDPYARTTGVNGNRAMVLDLDSTDPEGWDEDVSPNKDMEYTDAVIYELHVRDFSIDDSSGVSDANQGKYLAFTETGTTTPNGETTGIDYLADLGITHLHLLPVYDYGSVDETKLDTAQYNWGYDPVNYNVPEGSYSTNPYDGNVRVKEMKQMVQSLHDNGINVIMDVVYNHVYNADTFCFNEIVPGYFSRTNPDGSYSNGSYCGNDTASEREMVRKYIVDSVMYWAEEYHIDGFRFDLVGLLDTETINEVVNTVHEKYPDVIFYGEGWALDTAVEDGYTMATQANAKETPGFAYFSDTIRNLLAGTNGKSTGFVSGTTGKEEDISKCFTAATSWCPGPTQTVNYVSCHDNYTLMDKLKLTRSDASESDLIRMNNLAAAIYMTSQGIPFIHAGEDFLRQKVDENGKIVENSYNSSDYVNKLRWSNLENDTYADVSDYYKGLIEFRKNHAALRLTTAEEVAANVRYQWITNEVVLFDINGKDSVTDEVSDGIVVIFNATTSSKTINLTSAGVASGEWKVCIDGETAGIEVLDTITNGQVTVAPISAMVLVKGETVDTDSVYTKNQGTNIPPTDKLEITSFTADKVSPQTRGTTIKLSVGTEGGEGELQYRFYRINSNGEIEVFRDYSTSGIAYANPRTADTYTIYVDVKDEAGNIVTDEMKYTWDPVELAIKDFTANKASPQIRETTVTLKVNAVGEGKLQYRFYRVNSNGEREVFRDYSASSIAYANPRISDTYTIYVDVKNGTGDVVTAQMSYTWE